MRWRSSSHALGLGCGAGSAPPPAPPCRRLAAALVNRLPGALPPQPPIPAQCMPQLYRECLKDPAKGCATCNFLAPWRCATCLEWGTVVDVRTGWCRPATCHERFPLCAECVGDICISCKKEGKKKVRQFGRLGLGGTCGQAWQRWG